MRRFIVAALFVVLASAMPGARAGVTASVNVTQAYSMFVSVFVDDVFYQYSLYVGSTKSVVLTPATTARTQAAGYGLRCDRDGCVSKNYPQQDVPDGSFSVDPLGNSLRFVACLVPSGNNPCEAFDVTATRPSNIVQCIACVTQNAWVDPSFSQAGATVSLQPGISRTSYAIGGTYGGAPMPAVAPGYGSDTFSEFLWAPVVAVVP